MPRLPHSSLSSRISSETCPLSQWCYVMFSSAAAPFSSCPQSIPGSGTFPMSCLCIRWPKYWSFSFSISPLNEYSALISFWIDWFDLLVVQGTLKSLLQHCNSKVTLLQCSASFIVQFSHAWLLERNIALLIGTFVSKVTPLLFNTLSRLFISFIFHSSFFLFFQGANVF